jgi:hypothetical protein
MLNAAYFASRVSQTAQSARARLLSASRFGGTEPPFPATNAPRCHRRRKKGPIANASLPTLSRHCYASPRPAFLPVPSSLPASVAYDRGRAILQLELRRNFSDSCTPTPTAPVSAVIFAASPGRSSPPGFVVRAAIHFPLLLYARRRFLHPGLGRVQRRPSRSRSIGSLWPPRDDSPDCRPLLPVAVTYHTK